MIVVVVDDVVVLETRYKTFQFGSNYNIFGVHRDGPLQIEQVEHKPCSNVGATSKCTIFYLGEIQLDFK